MHFPLCAYIFSFFSLLLSVDVRFCSYFLFIYFCVWCFPSTIVANSLLDVTNNITGRSPITTGARSLRSFWMGQHNSAENAATGVRAATSVNDDGVILVKAENTKERPVPPYELRAQELYESSVRRIQIVPPLLRTSAGLSPLSSAAEPTGLNKLYQRMSSIFFSQAVLMEQEALQQQRQQKAIDTSQEDQSAAKDESNCPIAQGLREFAFCRRAFETNAAQQANEDSRAIDAALVGVNLTLEGVKGAAVEQSLIAELYNFVEQESHALLEKVTLAVNLLQNDVVVLLGDTWSLLTDAERTGV
ncbi:hypothetical protein Tc00.1047053504153.210 [Trypanosoma cruzi]|uniref:Uncharacterized protein n=1 Tax=Trypanosoma cruzi (strain CL Brener) TaxID=353153 RepID=Q4E2R2_TRYCC|nr:hypothetical protein Tc00.1047053504153.210 [Trypanosoma cruzi]EAN99063.1 hypothetical protein Tc00.1047053504153.210 [Trypanosoma cruzi]|eukprot:XP_820914.1 hypothetical protein [Trypanosoma cruzi strain CL Brener]